MKLSKVLPLAALGLVATLGLTACGGGGGGESEGSTNAKIMIWATAAEEAVVTEVVNEWNAAHPNNTFSFDYTAVPESEAGTTVIKDPTVNGAPALFLCADDHIANLVANDLVLKVTGSYADTIRQNSTAGAITGASYNGDLYGWPVSNDNGYYLYYDARYVTDAQASSFEGLLQAAAKAGKQFLMDVGNGYYANSFFMSPEACGLDSLRWSRSDDGVSYEVSWDSDEGAKVAEYISSLLAPAYDAGTFIGGDNAAILKGFQEETLVAAVTGTWMQNDLAALLGNNLKATKLPTYTIDGEEYQMASFSGSKVYCINKTRPVEEQMAAAELAQLLVNKESQLKRFETRGTIPCNLEAVEDPAYTENTTVGNLALALQNDTASAPQSVCAEGRYWDIGQAIGEALMNGISEDTTWKDFLKSQLDQLRIAA